MRIITISREFGSGGRELGHLTVSGEDKGSRPLAARAASDVPVFPRGHLVEHLDLVATPAPVPFGRARTVGILGGRAVERHAHVGPILVAWAFLQP